MRELGLEGTQTECANSVFQWKPGCYSPANDFFWSDWMQQVAGAAHLPFGRSVQVPARLHITLLCVEETQTPELTDKLSQNFGFSSEIDLRAHLRRLVVN